MECLLMLSIEGSRMVPIEDGNVYRRQRYLDILYGWRRIIELPFAPFDGLLLTGIFGMPDLDMEITQVRFDVLVGRWEVYGEFTLIVDPEKTPESLEREHPGWTVRNVKNDDPEWEGAIFDWPEYMETCGERQWRQRYAEHQK